MSVDDAAVKEIKERVRKQYGGAGDAYVVSATHREGADLDRLVEWAELTPEVDALDVATGGGHTARAVAPHVRQVTVTDLTPNMLQHAEAFLREQGITNATYQLADAENLPFEDASFDVVTCRIAPHHFANIPKAVQEASRVLRPGGRYMVIDTVVREDAEIAEFNNLLDQKRDPSHVQAHTFRAWVGFLVAAGLEVEAAESYFKRHPWDEWVTRSRMTPDDRAALEEWVRSASPRLKTALMIEQNGDEILAFTDRKTLFKTVKR